MVTGVEVSMYLFMFGRRLLALVQFLLLWNSDWVRFQEWSETELMRLLREHRKRTDASRGTRTIWVSGTLMSVSSWSVFVEDVLQCLQSQRMFTASYAVRDGHQAASGYKHQHCRCAEAAVRCFWSSSWKLLHWFLSCSCLTPVFLR